MSKATARDVIANGQINIARPFGLPERASIGGDGADAILSALRAAGLVVVHSGAIHKALQDAFQMGANYGSDRRIPLANFLEKKHQYCDVELDRLIAASQSPQGDQEDKG